MNDEQIREFIKKHRVIRNEREAISPADYRLDYALDDLERLLPADKKSPIYTICGRDIDEMARGELLEHVKHCIDEMQKAIPFWGKDEGNLK